MFQKARFNFIFFENMIKIGFYQSEKEKEVQSNTAQVRT